MRNLTIKGLVRECWCHRIQELIEEGTANCEVCVGVLLSGPTTNHNSFLSSRNSRHQESYLSMCVKFQMRPGAFFLGFNRSLHRKVQILAQDSSLPCESALQSVNDLFPWERGEFVGSKKQ